jgi:hypothetical protein
VLSPSEKKKETRCIFSFNIWFFWDWEKVASEAVRFNLGVGGGGNEREGPGVGVVGEDAVAAVASGGVVAVVVSMVV